MKISRLATAAAAAALLAACTPSPTTAAVIEGAAISEAQVDAIVGGCASALDVPVEEFSRSAVVRNLVVADATRATVPGAGDLTDEDLDEAAGQLRGGPEMLADPECSRLAHSVAMLSMLQQTGPQVLDLLAEADVELNPRYGKWDPSSPELFDQSGSLSVPAG